MIEGHNLPPAGEASAIAGEPIGRDGDGSDSTIPMDGNASLSSDPRVDLAASVAVTVDDLDGHSGHEIPLVR